MIKKRLSTIYIMVFVFILLSCQKQTAPSIETTEVKRADEMERLKACTEVNFSHDVLLYQNALLLFKCTKWDAEYPAMFGAMKKISADSWNQLMFPVNETFLENQDRKNKFFKSIRDLDSKGGLDDLSYVIAGLNESNFFDAIRSMFLCMDNSQAEECKGRIEKIPSRRSIKQILHVLDLPSETIENNIQLLHDLSNSVDLQKESLRTEVNKMKQSEAMSTMKIALLDAAAEKFKEGLKKPDRDFLPSLLLAGGNNKDVPWIFDWIHDEKMGRDKFRDLLEYPALVNPTFTAEVRGLKGAYNANCSCSIQKEGTSNEHVRFDFRTHMDNYVTVVKDKDYKSFYDFSSNDIVGLKISTPICMELEQNKYGVNFIKLLTDMSGFLKERKNYDIFKFAVTATAGTFDAGEDFASNLYLFDFFAGDLFLSTNNLSKEIVKSTRELYPVLYDIIKNLSAETYVNTGEIAKEVFKKDYDSIYRGIADYWLFLRADEKTFLMNFVDRHFDKNIKYVMLFNFYLKTVEDYKVIRPIFYNAWIGNEKLEEMTMLSVQDFVNNMSGKEALADFKKFFSRNQIIKVLEVLASGQKISEFAKSELDYQDTTNYVIRTKSDKYKISVKYNQGNNDNYDASSVVACMANFSNVQNGFYDLIKNFPNACQKVASENIAFRLFGWMNGIDESYSQFKKLEDSSSSFFDKEGLLGPYMLNTQIGLLKIIDTVVGPYQMATNGKGLEYLLRSANYHFNEQRAAPLIEKNIIMINQWQELRTDNNIKYRNLLIKTFSSDSTFDNAKNVFIRLGKILQEYGVWLKQGSWKKASERNLGEENTDSRCEKVINQHIAPNPCPSSADIKKIGNDLLYLLSNVWEKSEESPVVLLMRAYKENEGLEIPLDAANAKKYRITLEETFKYLFDTSNKSLPINNLKVQYTDKQGNFFNEQLTTLERIETVIREVSFSNNYLGVSYLNHVVGGSDYNADVSARKNILSKCIKIPGARCGRKMSDSDVRMTKNALATYDSLLDANNGRDNGSPFRYGNYLKTFQQTLVGSSAKESQAMQFLPFSDAKLLKHNGKVLSELTYLTGFSNAARVLRDRVGRTPAEFNSFMKRADFKRVDRTLMYGLELNQAGPSAERLIKKIMEKQIFNDAVDWISSLSYEQTRLVEDTVARLLVVASYLGSPDIVFEQKGHSVFSDKYKDNNVSQLFLSVEKIVDYWPTIKKYFLNDSTLIGFIKPINTSLYFLTEKLNATADPEKNIAYQSLNDIYLMIQALFFDDLGKPMLSWGNDTTEKGLDFILALLDSPEKLDFTSRTMKENYRYLDHFHSDNGEWFMAVGKNIERLAIEQKLDLVPVREYLKYTTKEFGNILGLGNSEKNYHYDEIASIVKFLLLKSPSGESNFMLANKRLLLENIDEVIQIITDIFPAIIVKDIHPPLQI